MHRSTHTPASRVNTQRLSLCCSCTRDLDKSTLSPHISCSSINSNHMRKSNPPTAISTSVVHQMHTLAMNHFHTPALPFIRQTLLEESKRLAQMASRCDWQETKNPNFITEYKNVHSVWNNDIISEPTHVVIHSQIKVEGKYLRWPFWVKPAHRKVKCQQTTFFPPHILTQRL